MTALRDVLRKSDDFRICSVEPARSEIAWKKDVGLPLSANLADVFVFKHVFKKVGRWCYKRGRRLERTGVGGRTPPRRTCGTVRTTTSTTGSASCCMGNRNGWNWVGIGLDPNIEWEPRVKPWLAERKRIVEYPVALQPTIGEFRLNARHDRVGRLPGALVAFLSARAPGASTTSVLLLSEDRRRAVVGGRVEVGHVDLAYRGSMSCSSSENMTQSCLRPWVLQWARRMPSR